MNGDIDIVISFVLLEPDQLLPGTSEEQAVWRIWYDISMCPGFEPINIYFEHLETPSHWLRLSICGLHRHVDMVIDRNTKPLPDIFTYNDYL